MLASGPFRGVLLALSCFALVTTPVYSRSDGPEADDNRADFIFIHGALVFFMQIGFISLESGYVRSKNVKNILMKNTVNVMLCALCWWALGYAFAYGKSAGGFIGTSEFFIEEPAERRIPWFFSWTFALCTVTIVSGCLAERTSLVAYPIYAVAVTMWVHPCVVHWVWNSGSWLQSVSHCHFLDFSGGTVVHTVGGLVGIVGAIFVGPRIGRFEDGEPKSIPGHDVAAVSTGTFFLWFGWYGFNLGSVYLYGTTAAADLILDRVALNMTLAACTAGLTTLLIVSWRSGTIDLCLCCNGIISGLVSAASTSGFVAPWASAVSGIIVGAVYVGSSKLVLYLRIDDPLDSGSIHYISGVVGTLLNAALAKPQYVKELTGSSCGGFIYDTDSGGMQLGVQLLGVVAISAWVIFFSVILFGALRYYNLLRVDQTTELAGIDNIEHGGPAYPEFNRVATVSMTSRG